MAGISGFTVQRDYSFLFSGMARGRVTEQSTFNFGDYAAIRNGSYGKLLKAHYKKESEGTSSSSKTKKEKEASVDDPVVRSSAEALKKSAETLSDPSLWEKKLITKTDATTGEKTETEDYDWTAITKAIKTFVTDYNDTIDKAKSSDNRSALRIASWTTGMTGKTANLLAKSGITIDKNDRLTFHEDTFKKADIITLESLFSGNNSFADKVAYRANSIRNAVSNVSRTYTKEGKYSEDSTDNKLKKLDEKI